MKRFLRTAVLALASLSAAHAEDNWGKMKDCAAQADKFEKKESRCLSGSRGDGLPRLMMIGRKEQITMKNLLMTTTLALVAVLEKARLASPLFSIQTVQDGPLLA